MRVTGLVDREVSWEADDLDRIHGAVDDLGKLADGFVGKAIRIAPLLKQAGPYDRASHVTVISDDGHYRASIPLLELEAKGWLAYRLGPDVLPRSAGGPFRAVVPQGATLCWNVKSVTELKVTDYKEPDSVPARPKH
ncbi:MAG: molybdopterin-dependent oxidoreductase [Acidimicrobiia bacterium]